jgi:hypothetical protein
MGTPQADRRSGYCAVRRGFKSVAPAAVTIAGIELAHRIRKHQFRLGRARGRRRPSMLTAWNRALFTL